MRTAVVGCGSIADEYGPGLAALEDVRLVGAMDLDRSRAVRFANRFVESATQTTRAFEDLDRLLDVAAPDLVVNLTIHTAHASVTERCLRAGCHVYSEKPIALDASRAARLLALADDRGVGLACAPANGLGDAQRLVGRLLDDGRTGPVRAIYADCNIGRLTEWHDDPEPFLRVGPLFDGAVYPLSVLTDYFGAVTRVETAHASHMRTTHEHDGHEFEVDTPDHVVAILRFEPPGGPPIELRLTASMYVPYQTNHFNSVEIHGDDGSIHLRNCGATGHPRAEPAVEFARVGSAYVPVRPQHAPEPIDYADGVGSFVAALDRGGPKTTSARRAAHLVSVVEAIDRAAREGSPVDLDPIGVDPIEFDSTGRDRTHRIEPIGRRDRTDRPTNAGGTVSVPPIGFGCSRYRGGEEFVDRRESIRTALDAGYRLFDGAELYGNEGRIGRIVDRPGSPDRDLLFLTSKVWNTNHAPEHVREACETTLGALGIDALDAYLVHWPTAWAYQGPLEELAERSPEIASELPFPTDESGDPIEADVTLAETWQAMEALVEDGLVRSIGVSNFDVETLDSLRETATVPPAIVQFERHPYRPNNDLLQWSRTNGAVPMAHSPLSAPGLLDEGTIVSIGAAHDVSPAQVVLRWNVQRGVVPIPSSSQPDHVVENADVFRFELSEAELAAIDALFDPTFER
ncbi:MAG: aldo/keto reductase [Halobacteriota archaeon]